jgi:hypothetical protein
LKRLGLANNTLSGTIPPQIGQLEGASILLNGNLFHTAPLSLCNLHSVKALDIANNMTLCPMERNALSDFYDATKGAEWTDGSLWLDEYANCCDWKGVTCNEMNRVTELNLSNNGLSGRLSESIGYFRFIEVLDLSDNDIKVMSIFSIQNIIALIFIANPNQTTTLFSYSTSLTGIDSNRDRPAFQSHLSASELQCFLRSVA